MGEVMVVTGSEVAPATPPTPKMVDSPVIVEVTVPLVMTEVNVLVDTGVERPVPVEVTVTTVSLLLVPVTVVVPAAPPFVDVADEVAGLAAPPVGL